MANEPQKGTLYDSTQRDSGGNQHGVLDLETGHVSNWWDDGYRYSHDNNDENGHWTNQNEEKGSDTRHDPPADANK